MSIHASDPDPRVTRQRLLEAAGEVFAEQGFRAATVRDICKRAGANIAAIHYHFGGKEEIYAAAVRYAHGCATHHALDAGVPKDATPEQRLRAFVHGFLLGILDDGRPAWHAKLMVREIADPTRVLDEIAETGVRPRIAAISAIIRAVIGAGAPDRLVHQCARSIVGQILFYHFARPMLDRVFPNEKRDASAVDALADHITAFSLGGLRNLAKGQAGSTRAAKRKALVAGDAAGTRNGRRK